MQRFGAPPSAFGTFPRCAGEGKDSPGNSRLFRDSAPPKVGEWLPPKCNKTIAASS